jgi:uncharacterized membrane protein YqhA
MSMNKISKIFVCIAALAFLGAVFAPSQLKDKFLVFFLVLTFMTTGIILASIRNYRK